VADSYIFDGRRSNITNWPAIGVIFGKTRLSIVEFPYEMRIQEAVVAGEIHIFDESKQLVGSGNIKGILDMIKDIEKALTSDTTLNGECIDINILNEEQDDFDVDYPNKGFKINIEILYRQDIVTRA
jgi:hypothetical protein